MDTDGTPPVSDEDLKTSGKRSKPTKPSNKPADKPRTRWKRSLARSAISPPNAVERTVNAAK